ncbi:MAG: TetR/AcrR family transcriptional regulator [Dehalococcoidia bacterium]|nr:TetR/AcrR family transcriptional regulator [Dehalococcoidia bacterium]
MPKVTEAHLEARRSQILDAAWTCFARKGYHQATMQDICQESGLSPGAIYRYFESKEAILKAINERSLEMGRALVEEARSLAGGPLNTLEVIGQTMLSYFNDPMAETTSRVNIEIFPEIIRNEELRAGLREELTFWHRAVTQLLSEAKERGQLKAEVDPDSLAALLMCAWEGVRHYSLIDPHIFRPERLIELMRALVSEGVVLEAEKFGRELAAREPLAPPLGTPFGRRSRKEGD